MMDVLWFEQSEADAPAEDSWFSSNELHLLHAFRFAKRRADWRLGRWTGKKAVAFALGRPDCPDALSEIEILSLPSGEPRAFLRNLPAPVTISLSHRAGVAVCAVVRSIAELGCDLEVVEPRSEAFLSDYFTGRELRAVEDCPMSDRSLVSTALWSSKESALKALHEGLRLDTRTVEVELEMKGAGTADWQPMRVTKNSGRVFHGWWQSSGKAVRTVVCAPCVAAPKFISGSAEPRTP